jgi:ABC-type iron transport system FetAB permease component
MKPTQVGPQTLALVPTWFQPSWIIRSVGPVEGLTAPVGIFALSRAVVTQRTREIGIRIALGSTVRQAMLNVSSAGIRAALMGLILGLALVPEP